MSESSDKSYFFRLADRIDKIIDQNPVTPYQATASKVLAPLPFLQKFAPKELILFHRFSLSRIISALKLILNTVGPILKGHKDWHFKDVNRLCVYYTLAASCCRARPVTENEEVADESIGRIIIQQSNVILSSKYGKYTNYLHSNFIDFLAAVGAHSSLIYTYFLNNLIAEISANTSVKNLNAVLKPWTYMPASIEHVATFLKPIASNITLITDKYKESFCQMLTAAITMALKRDPLAYYDFLRRRQDIMISISISEQIASWNQADNPFTWPVQIALTLLQPLGVLSVEEFKKGSIQYQIADFGSLRGQTQAVAIQCLLVLFKAFSASNGHPLLRNYIIRFFPPFLKAYLDDKITVTQFFEKGLHVDFPITALLIDRSSFTQSITPKLLTQGTDGPLFLSKLIKRFCKVSTLFGELDEKHPIHALVAPCLELLKLPLDDPHSKVVFPHIVKAFTHCPYFMRACVFSYPEIVDTLFKYTSVFPETTQQFIYLSFFDPKFADDTPLTKETVGIFTAFLKYLFKRYSTKELYLDTAFADTLPQIVNHISESILAIVQNEVVDPELVSGMHPMLNLLETFGLVFLASSRNNVRQCGVSIFAALPEILHSSEYLSELPFPLQEYQFLVTECRREKLMKTASPSIKNALRTIADETPGITAAYNCLFPYFMALSQALNPKIPLVQQPPHGLKYSLSYVTEEWIGTASILFPIVFQQTIFLFNQMKIFLGDNGDLGAYMVTSVPTAVSQRHLQPLMTIALGYFRQLQSADGSFDVSQKNVAFVNNIMKLVRGLTEQRKFWLETMINTQIFGQMARKVVSYCDVVQGEDSKLMALQMLISMFTLMTEKGKMLEPMVRHMIGKTILTWLPAPNSGNSASRQFIVLLHKALALILDDLSLMDCVDKSNDGKPVDALAEQQFMFYFASIKARLDNDNDDNAASDMIPVLASLLKQNLSIAIGHCLSMGFAEKNSVRKAFISAVAAVFKVPENKVVETADLNEEKNIIDLLYDDGVELVEFISGHIPYSKSETFGKAILEAAASRGIEFELLARMVDAELKPIDESNKNTIFRGNAVPARTVGHFPRMVGMEWLKQTLRPIFDDVIASCEQGINYGVDPARIPPEQNIEENRVNFRGLLNTCIDAINAASYDMPPALVRASQIIFEKVYAKVGDFAYNILSSFLFLRFLMPAFASYQMVGLPATIPESPRQALVQTSQVIMAAILKGKLDDKGPHLVPFNDIAKRIQDVFNEMFQRLVQQEVTLEPSNAEFDIDSIAQTIHAEVYPILQKLMDAVENIEDQKLLHTAQTFIQRINSMGQPSNQPRKAMNAVEDSDSQSEFDELMKIQFPDDVVQQLAEAIYREEHNAPDGGGIVYIHCNKLQCVRDPRIVAQLLFKCIMQGEGMCYVCVVLSGFDPGKIPNPTMLKKYSKMRPAFRIRQYLFFEPCNEFAQFTRENRDIFEQPARFDIVDSVSKLTRLIGPIPDRFPRSTLESFTEPQAIYRVVLNGDPRQIRLHEHSIQLINDQADVAGHIFTPVKVVMAEEIKTFERTIGLKQYPGQFMIILTLKSGINYPMRVPDGCPLYDAILQLTLRSRTITTVIQQVSVDTTTLHWLMLNLAFINMVCPDVPMAVRKAALDLAYAVFVSFNFGHSISLQKIELSQMPASLISYVQKISADIAAHNQDCYEGFLVEFFKALEYVRQDARPAVFSYLVPWVELYAKNPKQTELIESFVMSYVSLNGCDTAAFSEFIWPALAKSADCTRMVMNYIYSKGDTAMIDIVSQFAIESPALVSRIWSVDILKFCINEKKNEVQFIVKVIAALTVCHVFDLEGSGPELLHSLLNLRLYYQSSTINICAVLVLNIMHEIFRTTGKGLEFDFKALPRSFSSDTKVDEFRAGTDCHPWISAAINIASMLSECVRLMPRPEFRQTLCRLFEADAQNSDVLFRAQGMVYSAAFADDTKGFASKLIKKLSSADAVLRASIVCALSQLKMDVTLASQLFFLGCVLALSGVGACACELMCSAAKQYGVQTRQAQTVLSAIPPEISQYFETCSGLPFTSEPFFSALAITACYADREYVQQLQCLGTAGSTEAVAKVFAVIEDQSEESMEAACTQEFGIHLADVTASLLIFLSKNAKVAPIRELAINYFTRHGQGLGCFPAIGPKFGTKVLQEVNDARFTGLVLRNAAVVNNDYSVTPLLYQHFADMPAVQLSEEQAQYLISSVFP